MKTEVPLFIPAGVQHVFVCEVSGFLNLQSGHVTELLGTPLTTKRLVRMPVGAARAKDAPRTMLEMEVSFILNWKIYEQ